jgi:hypothetical protein
VREPVDLLSGSEKTSLVALKARRRALIEEVIFRNWFVDFLELDCRFWRLFVFKVHGGKAG